MISIFEIFTRVLNEGHLIQELMRRSSILICQCIMATKFYLRRVIVRGCVIITAAIHEAIRHRDITLTVVKSGGKINMLSSSDTSFKLPHS